MNLGIHSLPNNGTTNEWLTPPEILKALGTFDLDPCAHPQQPWRTAVRMIAPPEDGLAAEWTGRVFLNPPYGQQIAVWLKKLVEHGNGIALVPARTEVESWFWPHIWLKADAIFFFRGRLFFRQPDGSKRGNAGHGSVLAAYGQHNVDAIVSSDLPGRIVYLDNRNANDY